MIGRNADVKVKDCATHVVILPADCSPDCGDLYWSRSEWLKV